MSKRSLVLLAVVLLFFRAGNALGAALSTTPQLPITFKVNKTIGTIRPFTFKLVDSDRKVVWEEGPKSYPIPVNQTVKHKLGSVTPFAQGVGGPVDFSRQLTVVVTSGTVVYRSPLSVVPYALWSADSEASGEFVVRGLDGQTDSLQEWQDAGGGVLASVAADGTVSSSAGFVGDGSGLTNVSVGADRILGQVSPAAGGTGMNTSTAAKGSLPYLSGEGTWDVLGIGDGGKFLGVGAAGLPEWQALPAGAWGLGGNDVDPGGGNFLGTTNAQPFQVRVGGHDVLRIEPYDGAAPYSSPNIVAGFKANGDPLVGNAAGPGAIGAVIGGGGGLINQAGEFNFVNKRWGTIGGGAGNRIDGPADFMFATIGGGFKNVADGERATIAGGQRNTAEGTGATIGGGYANVTTPGTNVDTLGIYNTVAGGIRNAAANGLASVGGGWHNLAGGSYSGVAGGEGNWATGTHSVVGGGGSNTAGAFPRPDLDPDADGILDYTLLDETTAIFSTVGGGDSNVAGGSYSVVPGGSGNATYGDYSFAAGSNAKARTTGSFVWADSQTPSFPPGEVPDPTPGNPPVPNPDLADNQFWVRAAGGVYLVTQVDGTGVPLAGVKLPAGGSAWEPLGSPSDRNIKTDISPVDPRGILAKVAALPISTWSYRSSDGNGGGARHLGPMAQDFRAAFGLGDDDRHIAPVDASGVSLAAIQALSDLVRQLADTVAALERQLGEQRDETAALRLQVADLHARYARLRALMAGMPETDPTIARK